MRSNIREPIQSFLLWILTKIPPEILKRLYILKYYFSKEGRPYLGKAIYDFVAYTTQNPYGIPEPRINLTIFRFWLCPAYWRYLWTRFLQQVNLWHPEAQRQISQNRYLTGRPDPLAGFGHQLSNWAASRIYAQEYFLTFAHQPLSGQGGQGWEDFLDLSHGEILYHQLIQDPTMKRVRLPRFRWIQSDPLGQKIAQGIIQCAYPGSNILFELASDPTSPNRYDQTPISEILRQKYWQAREQKPVNIIHPNDGLNVACHIRRGDILTMRQDDQNFVSRWLSNSFFIGIIQKIQTFLPDRNIHIHVFSQGTLEHFQEFGQLDRVTYHLDEDEYQTFHGMVMADLLIVSPSSFSFNAGLISTGIKIARYPWWHEIPDNDEWLRCDAQGNFNAAPLLKRFLSASFR